MSHFIAALIIAAIVGICFALVRFIRQDEEDERHRKALHNEALAGLTRQAQEKMEC